MKTWKDAYGFEGFYEVSVSGKVRRVQDKKELKGGVNSYGYVVFHLSKNGKRKMCKGHRLVAQTFIPNPKKLRDVNHIDGDKTNNHISNLEWVSRGKNIKHARNVLKVDYSAKSVIQVTLEGDLVAVWKDTSTAAKFLKISSQMIGACCKGTAPTAAGHLWYYSESKVFEKLALEVKKDMLREKIKQLSSELDAVENA